MFELVVMDMAGTTIDEHGDVYRALRTAVEETGAEVIADNLQRWMGADKVEAIDALLRLGGIEASDALVRQQFDRFRELLAELYAQNPPVALEGVEKALRELASRGLKIALTTGFSADVAEPILRGLGWRVGEGELLDAVVTSDEVAAGRPAPYMIHRAMERTGVQDVRSVISVGDTIVDVLSAHRAGAHPVAVLTGALAEEDFAGYPTRWILDGVRSLPQLLTAERV
ncbi:phosphonatase-like hydrolase [Glutamicibacter endophyticus]